MNSTQKLISYCTGTLSAEDRLEVEEKLIHSKDFLIQFISVKRSLESDETFIVEPSIELKNRLKKDLVGVFSPHPVTIFDWSKLFSLKPAISLACGVGIVFAAFSFFSHQPAREVEDTRPSLSIDSSNQTPVTLNVL